jgi:MFS family permease
MRAGIAALVAGYVLSQFYRAFLAVLTPVLGLELGAAPSDLSRASGLWFLTFALMQPAVGWGLDRVGPRLTTAVLLALGGGGGAALFASAGSPGEISAAMMLIGVGCSPVLMASYFIFARSYPPHLFATLAGATIGFGSLGNVAGSIPLAWLIEAVGWRQTLWGLAVVTLLVAAAILALVRDPQRLPAAGGSMLSLLRMRVLWPILPLVAVNYTAAACLRGLWAGPYFRDVHGLGATGIGWATLAMGLAMIVGNFAYGPLDRVLGTRKWVAFGGNLIGAAGCLAFAVAPAMPLPAAVTLMAIVGLFGSSYALMVAHVRAFVPPHLTGRGVTLANMFSIGGVGLFQVISARLHVASGGDYRTLFLFFALPLLAGCLIYLLSRDSLD